MSASNLVNPRAGSFLTSRFHPSISLAPTNPNRVLIPLAKIAKGNSCMHKFAPAILQIRATAPQNGHRKFAYSEDPLWLELLKDLIWGLRSLAAFLAEQPSQLKHLEWPGLQNTLKTATLTLILVALFIVALSSVDCALSYILARMLRRSA